MFILFIKLIRRRRASILGILGTLGILGISSGSFIFIQIDFANQYKKVTNKILYIENPHHAGLQMLDDPDQHEFDHFQNGQKRDDDFISIRAIRK